MIVLYEKKKEKSGESNFNCRNQVKLFSEEKLSILTSTLVPKVKVKFVSIVRTIMNGPISLRKA